MSNLLLKVFKAALLSFIYNPHLSSPIYTNLNDLSRQISVVKVSKDLTQVSKDFSL